MIPANPVADDVTALKFSLFPGNNASCARADRISRMPECSRIHYICIEREKKTVKIGSPKADRVVLLQEPQRLFLKDVLYSQEDAQTSSFP